MVVYKRRAGAMLIGLSIASALVWQLPAAAQDNWPTKPVRLIVPSGAGSGTDIVARVFAESLPASSSSRSWWRSSLAPTG